MIEFVTGNFFDYDADIRVNTVNCVGVMGAGVALMFKNKFPEMFKDYYKACKENKVSPGNPHIWEDIDLFSSLTIINFPTKVHWKNPSEYEYIEKGLIWLRKYLEDKENTTMTLPALGCGHGGLDWEKVKELIIQYLGDLDVKILVFEPSSSTLKNTPNFDVEKLIEKDIYSLLPSDELYPSKLKGISAQEIYYKGNVELLKEKKLFVLMDYIYELREKNALLRCVDELPRDKFVFLFRMSNSKEIDIVKELCYKGFKIIVMISYGIYNFKIRKDLEAVWNLEKILILSIVNPLQLWKKYENYNLLKFTLEITDITLINSNNLNYIDKLKNLIIKTSSKRFYINYWKSNDVNFDEIGATKIGISTKTKRPNVLPIIEALYEI